MLANQSLLLRRFLQDTLRYNIRCCLFGDDNLRKTIRHMFQCIRHKAESRIIKNLLLYTKNYAQFALGAHLAKCAEKFKVENNLPLVTGSQIAQELIHNNQISLVRILCREGHHHITNQLFIIADCIKIRHFKINSSCCKIVFNEAKQNFTQRHCYAADFNAKYFKLACDALHLFCKVFILKILKVIRILGNRRNHAHQV